MKEEFLTNLPEENEIDLRAYWKIFSKYKWRIVALTLLVGLLTTLFTLTLPPIYRSTAKLLIESDKPNVISIEEVYGVNAGNKDYYQTQLEILKSRSLAEKVVNATHLTTHPEFDPRVKQKQQAESTFTIDWRQWIPSSWLPPKEPEKPLSAEAIHNAVVRAFMSRLTVAPVRNTQLIEISFEAQDAKLAATVSNTVADLYIKLDLEARLQMTHRASALLNERITELRQNLAESERALQNYLETNKLVDVSGVKSMTVRQIEEISSSLVKARQKLMEIGSAYQQIKALQKQPLEAVESLPAVLSSSLVQEQKGIELAAERRVSELSKRYGDKHPDMQIARTALENARVNTIVQIKKVITGITKEYEIAQANVTALEQALQENEKRIQEIGRKENQLKLLERDISVNRELYDLFLTRFKETDASQDVQSLQSTIGRMIDPAIVSSAPYKPQKNRIIAMSLVLGFLFATTLAFLLEYLNNTLKSGDDVEQKLKVPFLGLLPKMKVRRKEPNKPQLMFLQDQNSAFAEAVRTTRTGIMFSGTDGAHKILVVTSSLMGEGKTTVSVNQACALAQMAKTLLIDADMRRPSLTQLFGLDNKTSGLSELVAKTAAFSECVYPIKEANLDVIPSGAIPPNPSELLSSQRFRDILSKLTEEYEYIVIDSAPVHIISDALVLSKYATGIIYVVKADSTPYPLVADDLKRLRQIDTPLLGIVLNQLDVRKLSQYYDSKYGYYYNHYQSYSK